MNRAMRRHLEKKAGLAKARKFTDPRWFDRPEEIYAENIRAGRYYSTAAQQPESAMKIAKMAFRMDRSNVLEIGSGFRPISSLFLPKNLTLIDIAPETHAEARKILEGERRAGTKIPAPENIRFITANARHGIPEAIRGQHYSLTVMTELLTHVPPAERIAFLKLWAGNTDSMLIVDRLPPKSSERGKVPEYVNGSLVKKILEKSGFRTVEYKTEEVPLVGPDGRTMKSFPFFFLSTKRK